MTKVIRKTLLALGAGSAFVAVLATPGCAQLRSWAGMDRKAPSPSGVESSVAQADPASSPIELVPEAPELINAVKAPPVNTGNVVNAVNVFGEMDGMAAPRTGGGGGANFQQHTFLDEGSDSSVAVDPSGKWMVYASTRHAEHADIYLQRVDGLSVTQLTSEAADNAFPAFSPDGQQIAFCSTRGGNWDLYVMDRDGRNVVQVVGSSGQKVHPSFSPDGTRLAYSSLSPRSNQWELWTVNLKSGERRMIGWGLFPVWSPDKSVDRIAFQRARQRGSRWFSLWTLDLVDGEARRVTEVAVSTNAAIVSPCWSPDGQRLAFATIVEPARTHNGKAKGQEDIWVIGADGANRRRLTDGNSTNLTPFWAVDNRVYFISDRGGSESVWSAKAEPAPKTATAAKEPVQEPARPRDAVGSVAE